MDIRLFYLIKVMLTKLRISNEEEFTSSNAFQVPENDYVFLDIYKTLIDDLKQNKISQRISTDNCVFSFNGYDSKTNTYFYKMSTYISD